MSSLPLSTTPQQLSETPQAQLEQIIADAINEGIFPAATIMAVQDGAVRLHAAWGWIDPDTQQHPTQLDSLFDLASVTKMFTVTAFLSLMAEHGLSVETPLVEIIPEFGASGPRPIDGGMDPHSKVMLPTPTDTHSQQVDPAQVTFWHLLTHTSGLAPWRDVFHAAGPAPTPPDQPDPINRHQRWMKALVALCTYPFVGEPDSIVRYSDLGLMLLGEAASRLNGTPGELDKAIQARVLDPLELTSITYNPVRQGRDRSNIVPTEDDPTWRHRRPWGEVHDENACGVGGVSGHAGLFATAHDVAALGQAWLDNDPRLRIPHDLMDVARRDHAETDGARRGLGWHLRAAVDSSFSDQMSFNSYGHTGFTGTSLWIDPEKRLVVACLTNRVYPGREKPGIHEFRQAAHGLLATVL
ncbi:MAG: beta-lactamase family protein [Anaerolineae bacterium]|nr:beta-lactamase family protein [Anaerolineae bacterium]